MSHLRQIIRAGVLVLVSGCGGAGGPTPDVDRAIEEGDVREAYRLAQAAVAEEPSSAAAHVALSRAALHTMRTRVGVAEADRAIELSPDDPGGHYYRALHMQRLFRNVGAIESAREAARLAPNDPRNHVLLGELHFGGGMVGTADYEAAQAAFRQALALDPANERARFGHAKALILAGKHDQGLPEIEAFLVNRPYHGEARYLRGLSRMRLRDLAGAEDDFRRATRLVPDMAAAHFNLARVLQMQERGEEATAYRSLYERVKELAKSAHNAAVPYHISGDPSAALAYGQALAEIGRTDDAITVLDSAAADHPANASVGVALAEILRQAGFLDEAWTVIARTSDAHITEVRPHVTAAIVAAEREDHSLALEHARVAHQMAPDSPDIALIYAGALIRAENFDEAVRVLEGARTLAPGEPRVIGGLGEAFVQAGRAEEGIRMLNEVLRLEPRNANWLHWRGVARSEAEPRGAVQDLLDALRGAPNRVETYRALSSVLGVLGRGAEAAEADRRVTDLDARKERMRAVRAAYFSDPRNPEAASTLATLLEEVGREYEADRVRASVSAFGVEP